MDTLASRLASQIECSLPGLREIYLDLHQHPELSMQETRSAALIAERLRADGFTVTEGVGGTGVVGVLVNGDGPTVMLRADMDALPITEQTGLPYASTVKGQTDQGKTVDVMHACGHDTHMTFLLGASKALASAPDAWRGTLMVVFQPSEENGKGAQAMIADGMLTRFPKPDVVLGQHIVPMKAGQVGYVSGQFMSAADSIRVRFFGRGSHGSQPHNSIDPIVMACSAVMRLQTIVAREVSPLASAVVTVGEIHGGIAENIIPDQAWISLNVRTTDEAVRVKVLDAIERICLAESRASGAPSDPLFEPISNFPLTVNDPAATERVRAAFARQFGERLHQVAPLPVSEDFSYFARGWQVPYVLWLTGGADPQQVDALTQQGKLQDLPGLHSPFFAPVLQPTLQTGVETLVTAAGAWLMK